MTMHIHTRKKNTSITALWFLQLFLLIILSSSKLHNAPNQDEVWGKTHKEGRKNATQCKH